MRNMSIALGILLAMKKPHKQAHKPRYLTFEARRLHDITLSAWRAVATIVGKERGIAREALLAKMPKSIPQAAIRALLDNGLLIEEGDTLRLSPKGEEFRQLKHERRLTRDPAITRRMIH